MVVAVGGCGKVGSMVVIWGLWVCDLVLAGFRFLGVVGGIGGGGFEFSSGGGGVW